MQSTFALSYLGKQGNKPKTDEYVSSLYVLVYTNSAMAFCRQCGSKYYASSAFLSVNSALWMYYVCLITILLNAIKELVSIAVWSMGKDVNFLFQ